MEWLKNAKFEIMSVKALISVNKLRQKFRTGHYGMFRFLIWKLMFSKHWWQTFYFWVNYHFEKFELYNTKTQKFFKKNNNIWTIKFLIIDLSVGRLQVNRLIVVSLCEHDQLSDLDQHCINNFLSH